MRNILQYPITYDEAKATFEGLAKQLSPHETEQLIGDIRPMILQNLIDNFDQVWETIYSDQEFYER